MGYTLGIRGVISKVFAGVRVGWSQLSSRLPTALNWRCRGLDG